MKNYLSLITIFLSLAITAQKDLKIDYKLRGHIYASSSTKDTVASGYGKSDNLPKNLISGKFQKMGFFIEVDTLEKAVINEKYNGYKLYIVNKSDSIVKLLASDSRLSVVAQAFIDDEWQDIEYLPSSWCGNSYHYVTIKPNSYWEFNVPKFTGKLKTKLRYKLTVNKKLSIYTSEVVARINRKQLSEKQGHKPTEIMDPYID
jgi:hypothetical protein